MSSQVASISACRTVFPCPIIVAASTEKRYLVARRLAIRRKMDALQRGKKRLAAYHEFIIAEGSI
jgi:hypothetical protein